MVMDNEEKYKIAFRLTTGASSGMMFIQHHFYMDPNTDLTSIRSVYILLSYYVELLLKSRVVMLGNFENKNEINSKLINLSHDLIKISKELKVEELLDLGIKNITKNGTRYIIKTTNNSAIFIEDFVDIRYDYIYGKHRVISHNEHKNILRYIDDLFVILQKVKILNEQIR